MFFKAPLNGIYSVKVHATKAIPTGKFESVANKNRTWWQVWKPRRITRQIYEHEEIAVGHSFVNLEQGDGIGFSIGTERIASAQTLKGGE